MKILDFAEMNVKITWTLLLIGYNSSKLLKNSEHEKESISAFEITSYAMELLKESDDDNIVSLAISTNESDGEILDALTRLSETEKSDYGFEFKKFRAMYIHESMPSPDDDYVHGILKFNEIWDKFGFPIDSPNVYFEFKDYSAENFSTLIDIHTDWLKSEFEALADAK